MKSFKKYNLRINKLEIRNNSNKNYLYPSKDYSLFELVKWYENIYYNKIDSFLGYSITKGNKSINKNSFHNKEHCYVIGFFRLNYKEPEALKLELDCERYINLSIEEKNIVSELIKKSIKHIIKEVYKINK
jgi:hypothetical protein